MTMADGALKIIQQPTPTDNDKLPPADRAGPAIMSLLQQAAEVTRRNEERAQATANRLSEEVTQLKERNEALEARIRELQERATRAEQWLMHIYEQIHAQFIQPAAPAAPVEAERRRRA